MATKIPIKGIIEINGKQVENTFQNISKEARSLERDLKKLVIGTDEYERKSAELKNVNANLSAHKARLNETKKAAQEFNTEINNGSDIISSFRERLITNLQAIASGEVTFKSLGGVIKFFAAESWAAISSIPIIGWVAAAAAGIGLLMREVLQYNEQLYEANKLTSDITKLQGDQLDKMTIRSQTLEQVLGLDRKETLEAARNLVQNFGVTYDEAMDAIETGAIKGGKSNTEFLKSLKEYPVFFAKAGFSVKEFGAIVSAGFDLGIYDDKLPDALKEFDLSMREQTKSTRDALVNAFGATFSDDILKRVSSGKTTVKDALIEINQESAKYHLTEKQQAQLTADIFRGAGEDVGGFAKIMDAVTVALIEQGGELTETQKIIKDQIDSYNELGEAENDALKSDDVLALKREFELFWNSLKVGFYKGISYIKLFDLEFRASSHYMNGVFTALPKSAVNSFEGIMKALGEMVKGFRSGATSIALFFKGDFDGAKAEAEKFINNIPTTFAKIKGSISKLGSEINDAGLKRSRATRDAYTKEQEAFATSQRIIEERRAKAAAKAGNNFDGSEGKSSAAKKSADKAAKDAESARKREEAERQKYLDQMEKDEEESYKTLLSQLQEYQKDKTKLIENEFLKAAQTEVDRRNMEERKNLTEIAELEKKKIETKSAVAKENFQKSINIINEIEIQNEEAHRRNMRTLQEKEDTKTFEQSAQRAQRNVEKMRQADEDEINNITDLDEAKRQLTDQNYLQLTDQELRAIDNLEDAKTALREAADRKALAAQRDAINAQIVMLTQALNDPALSEEARAKLLADLDEVKKRATQLTGAVNGGKDNDDKKVVKDQKAAKEKVDVFGFSVQDWEDTFKNLDTTADKLKAAGMIFQALSNIGQMFSETTRKLGEKDFQKFEQIQDKKKKSLLHQLNEGYITNEEYNKQVQKLEAETANKKAEMEYKQAKADKIARMFSVIGNTAVGVAAALPNLVLAAIVGGLGALQLGVVASQPLPERPKFARGGFTGSGFGSADETGFRPAGTVHENEYVVPEWMVMSPRFANVIGYLENVRNGGGKLMAEGGLADSGSGSSATTDISSMIPAGTDPEMKAFLQKNLNFLTYLITNGVHIEKNAQNGKQIDEMVKDWTDLKNKNKH